MAKFSEIVYSVLDLLKETSDDAFYTEEHVLALVKNARALLLERKYKQTRNSSFTAMSDENKQQICVDLEPVEMMSGGCAGGWLKSTQKIPDTLDVADLKVYPVSDMLPSMVTFIPAERMPYVGYNKWLKDIIYAAKSADGYLFMHGTNPQFMYLEKARAEGVFADPEEAAALACDKDGENSSCDVMDQDFPLEKDLVSSVIEMVVSELNGSRFAPKDNKNNAHDDLGDASMNVNQPRKQAEKKEQKDNEE